MTIQLTAPILVAGLHQPIGTSLTLTASLEAELVNSRVASYVGYNPTTGGLVPANFATGSERNFKGLDISGNLVLLKNARQRVLSRCPIGHNNVSAGFGGYTTHITAALAGIPMAVQVGVANLSAATSTIAGSFGFDTLAAAVNSNQDKGSLVAAWNALAWNTGAASATQAVTSSATSPSWTFSDWIGCEGLARTDGKDGSLIHLNLIQGVATGDATFFGSVWAASSTTEAVATHVWRGYRSSAAGDYATTNQAGFPANSGNAVTAHIACIIRYVSMVPGVTLLSVGDSIHGGTASTGVMVANGYGWHCKARDILSSAALPVEVCNLGWPGQTTTQSYERFSTIASRLKGVMVIPQAFSTNDVAEPIVAANMTTIKKSLGKYIATAVENDMTIVLNTSTPCNAPTTGGGLGGASAKSFGSSDTLRRALDTEVRASGGYIFDVGAVLSGNQIASGTATGQTEYIADKTTDGVHPNDPGYTAWGDGFAEKMRTRL